MPQSATDMVPLLEGAWYLERVVDQAATMIGRGIFRREKHNVLHYSEEGKLHLIDGQILEARREYLYCFNDSGFELLYAEPPFSKIYNIILHTSCGTVKGNDNHICGNDKYNGEFEFNASGVIRIVNKVIGPRKNYVSTTILNRLSCGRTFNAAG